MTLRDHLRAIYEQHGRLTAELVVAVARPNDHPLHPSIFDRDPHEAAEAYYRENARKLIQKFKITYKETPKGPLQIREWYSVRTEDGPRFEPAEKVASDPIVGELIERQLQIEWHEFKTRWQHFNEFRALVLADLAVAA